MMMGFGFLLMHLFWGGLLALLIGGAVWLFRRSPATSSPSTQSQPTVRQILDARLARGEITQEEYDTIRARLGQ
jgi:uncharacterized membrane protein